MEHLGFLIEDAIAFQCGLDGDGFLEAYVDAHAASDAAVRSRLDPAFDVVFLTAFAFLQSACRAECRAQTAIVACRRVYHGAREERPADDRMLFRIAHGQ